MIRTITLCLLIAATSLSVSAQEKLSGQIYGGFLRPYNDFTQSDYVGYKRNFAVGIGMGYQLGPLMRLRADIASGLLNGNDAVNYYETNIYEGQIGVDFNVIKVFKRDYDGFKLNLQGGAGMMMYAARLYDRATGDKVVESPVRGVRSFSPNAILTYGANVSFPITPKLDINFGYTNRWTEDVDWMDGQKSGDYSDTYGMMNVGFVFYLKSDKDRSKIEIDKKDLDRVIAEKDSLGQAAERGQKSVERVAELEMETQEKQVRIRQLEAKVDTLIARIDAETDTIPKTPPRTPADADAILANEQYRVVVASLPTEEMAQRWIDKSKLDKSEMIIAYISDLNTYRVVYKSYDSYPAARKEMLNIKAMVSDAWVVKF
tara:strand:- start:14 stop:1135 length:1122 start_codon:yes stop_codon:yes gene_type:complete